MQGPASFNSCNNGHISYNTLVNVNENVVSCSHIECGISVKRFGCTQNYFLGASWKR